MSVWASGSNRIEQGEHRFLDGHPGFIHCFLGIRFLHTPERFDEVSPRGAKPGVIKGIDSGLNGGLYSEGAHGWDELPVFEVVGDTVARQELADRAVELGDRRVLIFGALKLLSAQTSPQFNGSDEQVVGDCK
jgi:hypothetical protein